MGTSNSNELLYKKNKKGTFSGSGNNKLSFNSNIDSQNLMNDKNTESNLNIEPPKKGNKIENEKEDKKKKKKKKKKKIKNDELKKILFLYVQYKELQEKIKQYLPEKKDTYQFYLINKTFIEYDNNYNLENIFDYLKNFNDKINNIKILKENFDTIIDKIYKYCKVEKIKDIEDLCNEPIFKLNLLYSYDIQYPNNFFLIDSNNFLDFIEIFNDNIEDCNCNKYNGLIIKDYILIENERNEKWKYLACSFKENEIKVDFIFLNNEYIKEENIKEFLEKTKFNEDLINKKIKLNNNKDSGYVICFPSNSILNIFIKEVYDKIRYYFSLDRKYNDFILNINNIKNYNLKSISINKVENIIFSQMKIMSELLVFSFDANYFNNILDRIYYNEYNIYCNNSNIKDKEEVISSVQKKYIIKDKKIKDKLINYSPLNFDNCLLNYKNNGNVDVKNSG